MRVLIATGLTHWGRGGVQRETEHLLEGLLARGTETGFVVDRPLELPGLVQFTTNGSFPNAFRTALHELRPDVAHVIGGGATTILSAGLLARVHRVPWVLTVHNLPPRERASGFALGRNRLHYVARDVAALPTVLAWRGILRRGGQAGVIVHSSAVQEECLRAGCAAARLRAIPLGLTPFQAGDTVPEESGVGAAFSRAAGPRIVTVAGFAHTKGLHDFLRVLPDLLRRHPGLHWLIMGEPRYPTYVRFLEAEVRRLALAERVTLAPNVSEAFRLAHLSRADLYVQPSHEEGFCLTYLEAAQQVPRLLGTRTGAIPEISEGVWAARVVPPGDEAGLLRAAEDLLAQPDARCADELPRRAALLAQRFSWSRHAEAHLELYASVRDAR